jgi:hypothetical protein
MKKSFLFGTIVALAIALVGCKDDRPIGDIDYTSISFKESIITVICGDTTNLSLLYQPATLSRPNAEWSSADTALVKVIGKGIIVAASDTVGTTTVTAKVNDLVATCEVTVNTYQNLIGFDAITYFPSTKQPIGAIKDTVMPSGNSYKIQLCRVRLFMPDNLGFDSETLYGEGYAIFADAALYFVNDSTSKYNGQMFSERAAIFRNDSLDTEYAAQAGSFDANIVGDAVNDTTLSDEAFWAEYDKGVPGAYLGYAQVDNDGVGYRYMHYGIVNDGYIGYTYDEEGNFAGTVYDLYVDWFNYGGYYFGLAIDWEKSYEENYLYFKEPYEKDATEYHYTSNGGVQAAPRFVKPANNFKVAAKAGKMNKLDMPKKLQVVPHEVLR